jgi:hypothetical protein
MAALIRIHLVPDEGAQKAVLVPLQAFEEIVSRPEESPWQLTDPHGRNDGPHSLRDFPRASVVTGAFFIILAMAS